MIICIDIDGTLTDFGGFVNTYGNGYFKKRNLSVVYSPGYDIQDSFKIMKAGAGGRQGLDNKELLAACRNDFWKKHYVRYCFYPFRDGAASVLRQLSKDSTICIVSSREHTSEPTLLGSITKVLAVFQLKTHGIKYSRLFFAKSDNEKVNLIKQLHADIAIDDKAEIVKALEGSMKLICFNTSYNASAAFSRDVFRANNWKAVGEYIL